MKHSLFSIAPIALLVLVGAGCNSSSSSSRPREPAPSPYSASALPGGDDQASKVPSDVPVYPGGTVIAVTGDTATVHVAQLTPDTGERVVAWIKAEFERRGASFKRTSQEGASTNLVFETNDRRYSVRVDQPRDGGAAFLTISRGPNNAVLGQ